MLQVLNGEDLNRLLRCLHGFPTLKYLEDSHPHPGIKNSWPLPWRPFRTSSGPHGPHGSGRTWTDMGLSVVGSIHGISIFSLCSRSLTKYIRYRLEFD